MARPTIHEAAITFRCPPVVREAIHETAGKALTNPSGYVRAAVMERLRADGQDVPGAQRRTAKPRKVP